MAINQTARIMADNPPPAPKARHFDCTACDGSGWTEPRHNEMVLRGLSEDDSLCEQCNGTGKE